MNQAGVDFLSFLFLPLSRSSADDCWGWENELDQSYSAAGASVASSAVSSSVNLV